MMLIRLKHLILKHLSISQQKKTHLFSHQKMAYIYVNTGVNLWENFPKNARI